MDDCEADRRLLVCFVTAVGIDPADECCPDIEAIANGNGSLPEKTERLRTALEANFQRKRGAHP